MIKETEFRKQSFSNGMTVSDLKRIIQDWPETDLEGNPCEVWVFQEGDLLSSQATSIVPLNPRYGNGVLKSADLIIY